MTFNSLIQLEGTDTPKTKNKRIANALGVKKQASKKRAGLNLSERGCEFCPTAKSKGIRPVKLPLSGSNPWLLVFQSPGPNENGKKKPDPWQSYGAEWLADEMSTAGIDSSLFDIQYAVRCMPADVEESSYGDVSHNLRKHSKQEIHCCSLYNEQAVAHGEFKQVILIGVETAKIFLAVKSLPKQKVFWSEPHKAKIYILTHPSAFIKGYANNDALNAFRQILHQFKKDSGDGVSESFSDPYAFIKKQDYRLILTGGQAIVAKEEILRFAAKGIVSGVDIEYDDGKLVSVAFSPKSGLSFVFVVQHPDQLPVDGAFVKPHLAELLEDENVLKAFHYGCSDGDELYSMAGITLRGYVEDTYLREYLRFLDAREYGLEAISNTRFIEFTGYKYLIADDMLRGVQDLPARISGGSEKVKYDYVSKNNLFHMAKVSLETLRLYNGADADLTKRLQVDGKKAAKQRPIPSALLKLYIDLNFVLRRMEPNGPEFDYEQNRRMGEILPMRSDTLLIELRKLTKWPEFNPASPIQVEQALFDKLKLEFPFEGKRNTQKMTMLAMSEQHEFPLKQIAWRKASKAKSTYVDGYLRCARANKNRLRTKWNSTGTRTGRLSSGGDKKGIKAEERTMINLQNIHGDPQMKNMCVADRRWRKVFKVISEILEKPCYQRINEWVKRKDEKAKPDASIKDLLKAAWVEIHRWVADTIPDLKTFLVLDYGQIEIRVLAQLANDKNLIKDCLESDIHTRVGVQMTGWDADKIRNDKPTRTLTKNVHFGIAFLISKPALYNFVVSMSPPEMRSSISREMVEGAYDRYFARYKGVKRYTEEQIKFGFENKYVETLFGMRRYLDISAEDRRKGEGLDDSDFDDGGDEYFDASSASDKKTGYWKSITVNMPVQGTAHQLMICALVMFYRNPEKYKVLDIPVMDVHDALYFRVNVLQLKEAYDKARYLLEHESLNTMRADFPHIDWKVPIVTEAEAGLRLGSVVSVDEHLDVGDFMLRWYDKTRRQVIALNKEYKEAVRYNTAKNEAEAAKVLVQPKAKHAVKAKTKHAIN